MNELISSFFNMEPVYKLWQLDGPAYLFTFLVILVLAKLLYDLFTPFKLNRQLTEVDNKAVAVSFSGYMFGIGIVMLGVISTEPGIGAAIASRQELYNDLFNTVVWSLIGIILLNIARIVNDHLLLGKFNNVKELVQDRNVGTGAVEWGSYVGSALIIRAALFGEDVTFWVGLASTLLYFVLGQLGFILFGWIYQRISRFDLYAEIERDNVSAGVAFGASLTAIAILLSGFIVKYDSIPGFIVWFIMSLFFLIVSRYLVDKLILPGSLLDEEISRDQNWGAALVEGCVAIAIALFLVPAFLS
ncbi:MAG: DUF350 domain-containing protein [Calditrichaeota bacterium]|nr:DUF350 domain-containing protein [Calditrichota bacterium]